MEEKVAEQFAEGLKKGARQLGVELSETQVDSFYIYYNLLIEWNSMVNLTAITQMDEVITKHYVDSLSLVTAIKHMGKDLSLRIYNVIDVGTGAGFPGIPLKIAFPNLKITLLDSLNKRVKFLNEVITRLRLEGIKARHGRAEDIAREYVSRETYDLCVSRAVANLATLSEYCLPFVKVGGSFISYKSGKLEEEIPAAKGAIKKLGGVIENIETFRLPNADERSLIQIKKITSTSDKYPRKAGIPAKEPIR